MLSESGRITEPDLVTIRHHPNGLSGTQAITTSYRRVSYSTFTLLWSDAAATERFSSGLSEPILRPSHTSNVGFQSPTAPDRPFQLSQDNRGFQGRNRPFAIMMLACHTSSGWALSSSRPVRLPLPPVLAPLWDEDFTSRSSDRVGQLSCSALTMANLFMSSSG